MEQILTVTDAAIEKAVMVRSREEEPERHALWVEVTGPALAPTYDLYLQPLADAPPDAHVQDHGRISVVIPAGSIEALRGGTLDRQGDLLMGGLVLNTPQARLVGGRARPKPPAAEPRHGPGARGPRGDGRGARPPGARRADQPGDRG